MSKVWNKMKKVGIAETKNRGRKLLAIIAAFLMTFALTDSMFIVSTEAASVVEINQTSVILRVGDSTTLSVTGTNEKVAWRSSNSNVAKVNRNGIVKAKKAGTAKITATVDGKTCVCKVTVMKTYTWNYNHHKYQLIEKGMEWATAKDYCETLGGHLVTITSKNEQKSIVKALKKHAKKKNYWLGAEKSSDGNFEWVTGEEFAYSAFAKYQPDRDYEKCLMIYTYDNPNTSGNDRYKWNDLANEGTFESESWFGLSKFGFICEWD